MPLGVAFGQIITLPEQVEEAQALLAPVRADGEAQASGEPAAYVVDWQGGAEGERGRVRGRSKRPAYEVVSPLPREYAVYKRTGEPCPRCGARVRSQVVAGRTLYWCGRCQRRR